MTPLNFESSGAGRPLLALHGYGASLFSWRHLPSAFPDQKVIRVDFPGHGGSPPRLDNRYSLADHAQAVLDFIESEGLEDFDLVGHSMGGGVALMIAIKFMEQRRNAIKSLTLVDSLAFGSANAMAPQASVLARHRIFRDGAPANAASSVGRAAFCFL
jgi:pimeloyl-ACP methyl ester carboxylesterase